MGGDSETGELEDEVSVEEYSAETDRWRVVAKLPAGSRAQHAAAKLGDAVLVSGGLDGETVLDSLLEYRPARVCNALHCTILHCPG